MDFENEITLKLGDYGYSTLTYTGEIHNLSYYYKRKVEKLFTEGAYIKILYNNSAKNGYAANSYGYGFKLNEKLFNYITSVPEYMRMVLSF